MPYGPTHDLAGIDEGFDEPPGGPFLWLPYPLLAVSFGLTVIESRSHAGGRPLLLLAVLSLVAAAWSAGMLLQRKGTSTHQAYYGVYVVVRLVLTGAMVLLAPWYGIYAWFGYVESIRYFKLPRVFVPLFLNAVVTAASYRDGVPQDLSQWLFYGLVVLGSTVLVGFFAVAANRSRDRDEERARTLDDLQEANQRLEQALGENRGLQDRLLAQAREAGVLDERTRLAGEIHDTLAQALTGIITQLDAAGRAGVERHDDHLDRARTLAGDGLAEARRSLQALRPSSLDGSRLPEALSETAGRWSGTAGVTAAVDVNGAVVALSNDAEITLLRVAQEGLANVDKHAAATKVGLTLTYLDDAVLLDVRDDGVGFDPVAAVPTGDGHHVGLAAMRERLARVGGVLELESEPGGGTALVARVPIR